MSYGTLHSATSPILSRNSSATSRMMERLNIEKADGGAGITIGKFYVPTNCNIILIIMAIIFLLVGAVLTAISYRPRDFEDHAQRFVDRQDWSWQTKIVGPSFLTIGFLMLFCGLSLCMIGWKVSKEDRDHHYLQANTRISHVHGDHRPQSQISFPFMPTVSQALPVSLLSSDLPALIPVNILATLNDSSQQHLLSSTLDTATLAIDWGTLRPRRANSLQFPISSGDENDENVDGIILTSNDKKLSTEQRRQSLPAFKTPGSPVTSKKRTRPRVSRRDSTTRQAAKISGARAVIESSRGRSSIIPVIIRSISGSSAKTQPAPDSPCHQVQTTSMSKYYINNGSSSSPPPTLVITSSGVVRCCGDCHPVPTFSPPTTLRRDIACFPISASESSLDNPHALGGALTTVEVAPIHSSPNNNYLQVDPYPLLQTGNAGSNCDDLPRIEVTSPGRSTSRTSNDSFAFNRTNNNGASPSDAPDFSPQNYS